MKYSAKRQFSGNAAAAFQAVEATLLPNGFRIVQSGASRLVLKGRGMRGTRENPVRGATEVSLESHGGYLKLEASLGGVKSLSIFVCVFPLVLWGGFAVAGFLKAADGGGVLAARSLFGAGVWLLLGPAMSLWIRKRTVRALDDMLENAVVCARRA